MRKSIIKGFYKGLSFLFLMGMMFFAFNNTIEARYRQQDRELPEQHAKTKTDGFVENELEPHFATQTAMGDHHYFDDNRKASQAFREECPRDELNNFKDGFNNYYNQQNKQGSSSLLKEAIKQIKKSAEECSTKVFKNYYVFSKDFDQKIETAFKMKSGEVYSILQSADGSSPANVQSLKTSLEEWQSFKTNCISFVENKSMKQFGKAQELPSENLGVVLTGLQERNCPSKRKQMERFKNSQLFANFLELSNPCNGVEGCVQALQERVSSSGRSVFKVCREEQSQAEACCQTPLKCSYYPESKSHYQALLGSGSQKTCQSNPASLANWTNKTTEICSNSVDLCQNSCQEQLTAFREEFLQCFFLPDLQEKSLSLHGKNACERQISAIKGKFKELAKNFKEPDSNFQTNLGSNSNSSLNSLDQSSLSSPHAIAINCKKPLQDLDSQARAKAVYGELCSEFLAKKGSNQEGTRGVVNPSTLSSSSANVSSSGGRNTQGSFSGRDQSGSSFARDGGSSRSINGGARGEGESLGGRMISGGREFMLGRGKKKEEDIRAEFADGKDPIMNPFGEDKEFYPTRAFFNRKKWGVISDEQLEMEKKFEELLKREGFESEDDYKEYYNIVEKEKEEIAQAEGPLSKAVAYAKGKGRRMMSFVKRKAREVYNARYGDPREKRRLLKWWNELPGPEVDLMEEQKRLLLMFCRERNTCKKWGWETEEEEDETRKSPATQPPATQPVQPPPAVPSSGP